MSLPIKSRNLRRYGPVNFTRALGQGGYFTAAKSDGYTTPLEADLPLENPGNVYSKGWWTFTNYGQCTGVGSGDLSNCRLSIEGWDTLFVADPNLVGDAIINRFEFQLGSGNKGITSYVITSS